MDNGRSAFDYFVGQGLAPHQAAGIVGALQGESGQGLNPNAVNPGDGRDGSDSIGIGQWNGTRAQALKDFAETTKRPWNDLSTQLDFLHSELQGPESAAYKALLAAGNPAQAGQAMLAYERPKDWNKPGAHPERAEYATRAFAAYGSGAGQPQPQQAAMIAPAASGPPMFAAPPHPPAQPQQQQAAAGPAYVPDIPQQQMQPIFAAPRHQIDLSKLRAAFKPPQFYRGA